MLRSEQLPEAAIMRGAETARIRREAISQTSAAPDLRLVEVAGQSILLGRKPGGQVVAFAAHCPHQQTPLKNATFFEGYLRCPQHNYVYDMASGRNIVPTRDARPELMWKLRPGYLRTYRTEERDGWIWVASRPNPPPADFDAAVQRRPPASPRHFPRAAPVTPPEEPGPVHHPPEEVDARVDSEFALELPTTTVPGHIWRVDVEGRAVALLRQSFDPGPPCRYVLHMSACAAGAATVKCSYAKPWGTATKETRTFVVSVR